VGGVLAGLFVLAVALAIFITVRRRRRVVAAGKLAASFQARIHGFKYFAASLNAVRPFTHIDAHRGRHSKLKVGLNDSAIAGEENAGTSGSNAPDMEVSSTAPPPSYSVAI
jgi:hypothetical protein